MENFLIEASSGIVIALLVIELLRDTIQQAARRKAQYDYFNSTIRAFKRVSEKGDTPQ